MANQASIGQVLRLQVGEKVVATRIIEPEAQKGGTGGQDQVADGAVGSRGYGLMVNAIVSVTGWRQRSYISRLLWWQASEGSLQTRAWNWIAKPWWLRSHSYCDSLRTWIASATAALVVMVKALLWSFHSACQGKMDCHKDSFRMQKCFVWVCFVSDFRTSERPSRNVRKSGQTGRNESGRGIYRHGWRISGGLCGYPWCSLRIPTRAGARHGRCRCESKC